MPCSSIIDVSCEVGNAISGATSAAGNGFLNDLASGIQSGLSWMVKNSVTFWLNGNSPYLTGQAAALGRMHHWLLPVTAAVAVGGAIAAGARMILTRKHAPLLDLTGGLAVMGLAAAVGMLLPTVLMKAGDLWTTWILTESTGGNFSARITDVLLSGFGGTANPAVVVIVFGFIAMVTSGIQAVLLLFRDAAILVLAAVLPLAAAGAIAPATRTWIKKIAAWMLALVCYKPAAAAVYATAFTMIGSGSGLRAILTGTAMLVLSLFALPVLMKFFTWTTGSVGSSGGGTGQFLGMAASGALAFGAMRGAGPSSAGPAMRQADDMRTNGPASPSPGSPGGAGGAGAAGPSGTSGSPGPSGSLGPTGPSGSSGSSGSSGGAAAPSGGTARTNPGRSSARSSGQDGSGDGAENGRSSSTRQNGQAPQGSGTGTGTASGSGNASSGARTTSYGGAGAQAAGRGAGASAEAGAAGPMGAALFAAQAMASGAKNAAASSMEEEDRS